MALIYQVLRVIVLGVIAAAVDDIPVTWSQTPSAAYLPCMVAGWSLVRIQSPQPHNDDDGPKTRLFAWKKGDEDIHPKWISPNGTLEVIKKNSKSAEDIYQCSVLHHGRILGLPINLKFSFMNKQFLKQPSNVSAKWGQPLSVPCNIPSGPNAVITWTKNGADLPKNDRHYFLENELLIINVQKEDAGAYRCSGSNAYSNKSYISHIGHVTVEESSAKEPSILQIHSAQEITAPVNSKVILHCPFLGWPRPKLIWEKTRPGGEASELESTEEVLVLSNLHYDHEGTYTCSVEGRSDLYKRFNVSITEPVNIIYPPVSKEAMRASTVRFNCTSSGVPSPNITWYKDGQLLEMIGRINLRNSADRKRIELVISGITSDDAGIYQCFASNGISLSSEWARLNVTGVEAAAPSEVRCAPTGVSSVKVRWQFVSSNVTAYTVDNTPTHLRDGVKIGQPHRQTMEVVKVSEPLTPYMFQVRAYVPSSKNNVASDMSETVICQGQGVPIRLSKLEDDKVLISWQDFAEKTPGIVQWILQYKTDLLNGSYSDVNNITLDEAVTNYTLPASKSSPLSVRLLGSRSSDWLQQNLTLVPWTTTKAAGRQGEEGIMNLVPQDLEVTDVGDHSFSIKWRCEDAADYIYLVCWRKLNNDEDCQESLKTSATVEGLQPDTEYEVRVQVRLQSSSFGGAFSAPYHITTQPEEPKDLKYVYTSSGVSVWWQGTGVRTVRYAQNITQPLDSWNSLNVSEPRIELRNLDAALPIYLMVTPVGGGRRQHVLTILPRPPGTDDDHFYYYLGLGLGFGLCGLCALAGAATCAWKRVKASRAPDRCRRGNIVTSQGAEEEGSEMTVVRARVANGGTPGGFGGAGVVGGAGEPLLNGHVHITENPGSKTPNGRIKKGRRYEAFEAFDLSRNDHDTTMETVLGDTTTYNLFDTSRPFDLTQNLPSNNSFNKLPDDNMNSEMTFQKDNSQIPTLQPNG